MRVTSSMYYDNLYGANGSKLDKELFDVNKQIASGLKIQYASDDVLAFAETMRLDNELTTLNQVKKSTESGYKISNQSDVILNDFTTTMDRFRTLLINAANDSNSDASRDAIATELKGLKDHLMNLSNTSINGQYLFSGSATDIKPINDDGMYNGNDISMNSFLGSNSQQQYNLTGADLFLGEESAVRREVTTNAPQVLNAPLDTTDDTVVQSSTMSEFMGDSPSGNHYFYLRGTKSDGTAIKATIPLNNTQTVDDLLNQIGREFGNTANLDIVNVSLDQTGQIVIEDKLKGSSKLDFHLVGATDFDPAGADDADITTGTGTIDYLFSGSSNYDTASTTPGLYIKEFMKSPYSSAVTGSPNDAVLYDRTQFTQEASVLSSNVSQILKEDNSFATDSTKLLEVASGTTLDSKQFTLTGKDINGRLYEAVIDLDDDSTFTVDYDNDNSGTVDGTPTTHNIYNMDTPRVAVDSDEMTYRQLMDVVNMVVTNELPAGVTATDYDDAITASNLLGGTNLTYDGKISFEDAVNASTGASIAIYDSNTNDFGADSSIATFNTNNALTIHDPKTDFFKTIDEMIIAVENHKNYPDSTNGVMRNVGIENAIAMMDDLQEHVARSHSIVGVQSNTLTNSLERTEMLEISTITLRASVIDTDLAEASLRLSQLTLNYEAMQYTVGKVSRLSLVNYL